MVSVNYQSSAVENCGCHSNLMVHLPRQKMASMLLSNHYLVSIPLVSEGLRNFHNLNKGGKFLT